MSPKGPELFKKELTEMMLLKDRTINNRAEIQIGINAALLCKTLNVRILQVLGGQAGMD